jgi:hypothetical protein
MIEAQEDTREGDLERAISAPPLATTSAESEVETHFYPLWELSLARVREFVREPEALFWVFIFLPLWVGSVADARCRRTTLLRHGAPQASGMERKRGRAVA